MLQDYRLEPFLDHRILLLDSKEGEYVSIFGDHLVGFHRVIVKFAIVREVQFGLGVGAVDCHDQQQGRQDFSDH